MPAPRPTAPGPPGKDPPGKDPPGKGPLGREPPGKDPPSGDPPVHVWAVELRDEAATRLLAEELAAAFRGGDLVTLSGDLGAGKTAFARAVIRTLGHDPGLEVPSPTFTLIQLYDTERFPVVHADLYRVRSPDELAELGWDEAAEDALVLVEWPDRAGAALPVDRLDVTLELDTERGPSARRALVTGYGAWAGRLERVAVVGGFLRLHGWEGAVRRHIQGDASTRLYERLVRGDGATAILMNSPARTDTVPVRYGKTYSRIAHIAQDIRPFVAMARGLGDRGFSAPRLIGTDLAHGLALLEDLGQEGVLAEGRPVPERYAAAAEVLAALHALALPDRLPVLPGQMAGQLSGLAAGLEHAIPPFDLPAIEIEAELLLDWYLPWRGVPQLSQRTRDTFTVLWRQALGPVLAGPATWLLRDVHSPNLLWLPEREGVARVGLLDFQDAMLGSPAYDVASLCMDARVSVDEALELQLLSAYVRARRLADPGFDPVSFARDYAVMGAQRLTKIMGLFVRLDRRDGKPAYLAHLPRIHAYLRRALSHPWLSDLRTWYDVHVPSPPGSL